ncbi:energy transducer TonB [Aquabacterium humicola]|uniref:energy transducer TonB n=1 Tax=Aquabacterium humicola TaxID=3237377 RepID=UPI0025431637|nr:energy transducer TonB [Rubrivivax pictus]
MRGVLARTARRLLLVALAWPLASCIGLVVGSADYREVGLEQRDQAQVLAQFGEPARRETLDGVEVWTYKLTDRGPGPRKPVQQTSSAAFLVLLPVVTTTRYDDNFRVYFKGTAVVRAEERRATASGVACGIPSHAFPQGCQAGFRSEEQPAEKPAPPRYAGLPLALRACPPAHPGGACTCDSPPYPTDAQRLREQGTVRLVLLVEPDHTVSAADIVQSSGSRGIDQAALAHFRNACFQAARNAAGEPVRSAAFVVHHWRLP